MSRMSVLFEISLSFSPQFSRLKPVIIQFLKTSRFLRSEMIETCEGRLRQIRVYVADLKRVRFIEKAFKKAELIHASFSFRRFKQHEWADKWKEDFHIQTLGKSFVVVPVWREKEFNPKKFKKRTPLWMDPLSAFGSGEHETTQLIIRQLELLRNRFQSFLDMGTGTGLLSIAAVHCGASHILGFDRDKPSAACAQYNFRKNGFTKKQGEFIRAELSGFQASKKFDLVCANINSHILENYRREIVRAARTGGWVLVSGILKQTYASFREAFDGVDLRCLKVLKGRRWVSVLYRKQHSKQVSSRS